MFLITSQFVWISSANDVYNQLISMHFIGDFQTESMILKGYQIDSIYGALVHSIEIPIFSEFDHREVSY